jgi:uncharacterized membrane protein YoaK (UPF0700 family)
MDANMDYTRLSLEELVAEEKKTRKEQLLVSVLIGFMVGVLGFALVAAVMAGKDFRIISILLPSIMVYVFYRMAVRTNQRMAGIRSELEKKRAVQ